MSNNIWALCGNTLTFSLKWQPALGGIISYRSLESCYQPYGFVLPIVNEATSLMEYLEGREVDGTHVVEHDVALLVTVEGRVYLYGRYEQSYIRGRFMTGPGCIRVGGSTYPLAEAMSMALHLTNDTRKAIELVGKVMIIKTADYHHITIDEIVAGLKERGCLEKAPINRPIRARAGKAGD